MAYKTVLVQVTSQSRSTEHIKLGIELAAACEGHVIGMAATGIPRFFYQSMEPSLSAPYAVQQADTAEEEATLALDYFENEMQQARAPVTWERNLVKDDPVGGLVSRSPYADVVVIGQIDPDEPSFGAVQDAAMYVMMNSARPLLIVPRRGSFSRIHAHVLLAWDGGVRATRAMHNALPLLARAEKVSVVIVNPRLESCMPSTDPGGDISLYLSRHGITANILIKEERKHIGTTILSTAEEIGARMLVMGGYGHPRFREMLLGGATETVLSEATLPVLMTH